MRCDTCDILESNDSPKMSIRWRNAINRDRRVKGSTHHVALFLSYLFRPNGTGYGTHRDISEPMGISKDTVERAISRLIELGYLVRVKEGWRGQHSDYRVVIPEGQKNRRQSAAYSSPSPTGIGRNVPRNRPQDEDITLPIQEGTKSSPPLAGARVVEDSIPHRETAVLTCQGCGEDKPEEAFEGSPRGFWYCADCREHVPCAWDDSCKGGPRCVAKNAEDGAVYCKDHAFSAMRTVPCRNEYSGCGQEIRVKTKAEKDAGHDFCDGCRPAAFDAAETFGVDVQKIAVAASKGDVAVADLALCPECPHPRLAAGPNYDTNEAWTIRDTGMCPRCLKGSRSEWRQYACVVAGCSVKVPYVKAYCDEHHPYRPGVKERAMEEAAKRRDAA